MPIKETNYLKPFCDWKQLWEETEFEVYNGDTSITYKPMPIPSEVKHYERMLEIVSDDNTDDYEHLPKWEAVRMTTEQWERRIARRSPNHITKRKETK